MSLHDQNEFEISADTTSIKLGKRQNKSEVDSPVSIPLRESPQKYRRKDLSSNEITPYKLPPKLNEKSDDENKLFEFTDDEDESPQSSY